MLILKGRFQRDSIEQSRYYDLTILYTKLRYEPKCSEFAQASPPPAPVMLQFLDDYKKKLGSTVTELRKTARLNRQGYAAEVAADMRRREKQAEREGIL